MDDPILDPRRVISATPRSFAAAAAGAWLAQHPRAAVAAAPRAGQDAPGGTADEAAPLADAAARPGAASGMCRVLDAVGVVPHIGLGRAPLAQAAVAGAPGP